MAKKFQLSVTTPYGKCQSQADSLPHLAKLTPAALAGSPDQTKQPKASQKDAVAEQLLAEYRELCSTRTRPNVVSKITRQGCDLDLMRCYLAGMTTNETVEWLKENRQFATSQAAVGRYWIKLAKLPSAKHRR